MEGALVGEILTTEREKPPSSEDIEKHPFMEGVVSFEELDDSHIGVILSAKYAHTWELGERVSDGPNNPICIRTEWGWGLIGENNGGLSDDLAINCCVVDPTGSIQADLDRILRYDFTSRQGEKASPEQEHPSQNDRHAMKQFEATIQFDESLGHYRCGLPWREDRASAAKILNRLDTATNAKNRLMKAAERMRREPARKEGVWKQMKEYIDDGRARKVQKEEVPKDAVVYYLPLHIVTRPDKPNKWRLCHDAASKVTLPRATNCDFKPLKLCLNDYLLAGPDLLNRLIGVLLRFRRHEVVISSDIAGFFHQIYVHHEDIPSFRFFWFQDEEMTQIAAYEMVVHIFGATSSPAVATWVLRHHAKRIKDRVRPETVTAINKGLYVDDLMVSFPSTEIAREIREELQSSMLEGGFNLCKWKSTHKGVLSQEDDEAAAQVEEKQWEDPKTEVPLEKVLGVSYSFQTDFFSVKIGKCDRQSAKTRREMLSLVASVFDPAGFAAPATLKGKIIFQKATCLGLGWDDELPEDIYMEFEEWRNKLPELQKLRLRRWFATPATTDGKSQLHLFSDSSGEGYGVAAYIRMSNESGDVHNSLAFARAHVVPADMLRRASKDQENHHDSIPRLELTAARLAATVREMLVEELREEFSFERVVMWTDSETVLKWINDKKTRFRTFINNRITKILELTRATEWLYVPSEENPADDVSRGLDPSDGKWERFYSGPNFLWKSESEWPEQKGMKERRICINAMDHVQARNCDFGWVRQIASKVETWPHKLRRIATFCNFLKLWRKHRGKFSATKTFPTVTDRNNARDKLTMSIQQHAFSDDKERLNRPLNPRSKQPTLKHPQLRLLNPFIDSTGLLRVGGRISSASNLSYNMKHPMILPHNEHNVRAMALHEHQRQGHAGTNHVWSSISREFWILHGRQTVKQVIAACVECQKKFKRPGHQQMADLPRERIEGFAAFEATSMDVFGPVMVKNGGRAYHKRWILLFNCMTCRAVHFEMLRDLSSSTFINALVRFHGRRPGLRILYSDQATNFCGGERELKKAVEEWNQTCQEDLALRGIDWKHSPPHSPHCGGCWERLIQGAKRLISVIMERGKEDVDVYATMLVEVERIMNNRPITYCSSDPRDLSALTPADFLYPGIITRSSTNVLPPAPPGGETLRYQWQRARSLVDEFWRRWSVEYLKTLQKRQKWQKRQENLYVGQLVLMIDDQAPRDQWRLARVDEIKTDGSCVRTVVVKTAAGKSYTRHVTKLVALELE